MVCVVWVVVWGGGFCELKTSIWQNLFAKPPLPCMICSLIVIFGSIFTDDDSDIENAFKRAMPWLGDEFGMKDAPSSIFPGLSLVQWMSMQQNNQFSAAQSGLFPSMVSSNGLHNNLNADDPSKLLSFQAPAMSASNLQFNKANPQTRLANCNSHLLHGPNSSICSNYYRILIANSSSSGRCNIKNYISCPSSSKYSNSSHNSNNDNCSNNNSSSSSSRYVIQLL